jgi:hypothetical protein
MTLRSVDGHLKFWKKMEELVEFVKHYRAHLSKLGATSLLVSSNIVRVCAASIRSLTASADGLWLCTTGEDKVWVGLYFILSEDDSNFGSNKAAKFYDVVNFDMVNMLKLAFSPTASCWIHKKGSPHPKVPMILAFGFFAHLTHKAQSTHTHKAHTHTHTHTHLAHAQIAIADDDSPNISIFNAMRDSPEPLLVVKIHGCVSDCDEV